MKLLYKIFRADPESREGIITTTSSLGIVVNVLVALIKVIVGVIASSIAIISEGINNATDALTSVLTLLGTKLAGKHPDEKHPFGYGRIEYLTGLVISIIILFTGFELLKSSVNLIFRPEKLNISYISLVVVAVSAVIKLALGIYTIKMGRKASSAALEAVGVDCRNDSFISVVTIISAVVFLVFKLSIDAYVGIFTSVIILKSGFDVLKETISELIGRPGEKELANELYQKIVKTPHIINAADMMLHNYGPNSYSGSVNIEIDHDVTVGEVYQFVHKLQLDIMHSYNVTMVFGIYAVDNDHEYSKKIRKTITDYIREREHIKSYHAIYVDPDSDLIYCDFIVDYDLRDWESERNEFTEYMKAYYPEKEMVLTIETEFV